MTADPTATSLAAALALIDAIPPTLFCDEGCPDCAREDAVHRAVVAVARAAVVRANADRARDAEYANNSADWMLRTNRADDAFVEANADLDASIAALCALAVHEVQP